MAKLSTRTTEIGGNIQVEIIGLESVAYALGELRGKTPAAVKVAINQTARATRKALIASAEAHYAVNAKGRERLRELKKTKSATNRSLYAELFSSQLRADLSYFEHTPTQVYSGREVFRSAPEVVRARVLRSEGMKPLTGEGNMAKGFLARFNNGEGADSHIGMVQRVIGSRSAHTTTENGYPRWRNAAGNVEKLQTMGAPSGTAMLRKRWPEVRDEMELYLKASIEERVLWIINRAALKKAG